MQIFLKWNLMNENPPLVFCSRASILLPNWSTDTAMSADDFLIKSLLALINEPSEEMLLDMEFSMLLAQAGGADSSFAMGVKEPVKIILRGIRQI